MPLSDRVLVIGSDPHSSEVIARGGDPEAHSLLQRCGFVPVVRLHESYHRAPAELSENEEVALAREAVGRLRAVGYSVDCGESSETDLRPPHYLPLGAQIAHLADRLREATTTQEAAEVLTELTASHDGVLAALGTVLTATADFYDGLEGRVDTYTARRLRHLAAEPLHGISTDLCHTRTSLLDRQAPHPGRSTRTGEFPAGEHECSAVCACPPPARTVPAPPSPSAPAGPRR
ncbi:hypothetical protein [Streptomyces sp. NPDC090994]|uniref:hypothetical protein n=1 Tax=Streptomyces sp. NPDC090994 TaxID=3365969 RepID=UPI0037F3B1E9